MGSSSSRVSRSRKLPSKPSMSWAGARTDRTVPSRLPPRAAPSETKNALIELDAGDPHFMEKLKQLGPVKVDHHMATVPAGSHMKHVLQSREASEQEAASHVPPRNRVRASELFSVLGLRKGARSRAELREIADRYNLDIEVLESVAQFTNTPSTLEGTRRKVVDEEGRERFTVVVTWEDSPQSSNPLKLHDR